MAQTQGMQTTTEGHLPVRPEVRLPTGREVRLSVGPEVRLPIGPEARLPIEPEARLPIGPEARLLIGPEVRQRLMIVAFDISSWIKLHSTVARMMLHGKWHPGQYPSHHPHRALRTSLRLGSRLVPAGTVRSSETGVMEHSQRNDPIKYPRGLRCTRVKPAYGKLLS